MRLAPSHQLVLKHQSGPRSLFFVGGRTKSQAPGREKGARVRSCLLTQCLTGTEYLQRRFDAPRPRCQRRRARRLVWRGQRQLMAQSQLQMGGVMAAHPEAQCQRQRCRSAEKRCASGRARQCTRRCPDPLAPAASLPRRCSRSCVPRLDSSFAGLLLICSDESHRHHHQPRRRHAAGQAAAGARPAGRDDQLIAETTPEGLLLRPAVTLPAEVYTPEREREFDEAEAELAAVLARKPRIRPPRTTKR